MTTTKTRLSWPPIVARAADIVRSYDTGVTLRQLFYRLVVEGIIENTRPMFQRLSRYTGEARRAGTFPDLIDPNREIHRYDSFTGPDDALDYLAETYRRDRTEGQEVSLYFCVEKTALVEQLLSWFGDTGIPILALGGYASQSYVKQVATDVGRQGRPAVLLYAGDFDPSGQDIDRDFVERTGCFDEVIRVALNADQVVEYDLPPQMGKAKDPRASAFRERHGRLVQVELDALDPVTLRGLYTEAMDDLWDTSAYETAVAREAQDRELLIR